MRGNADHPAAWIDDIAQNGSAGAWDAGVFAPFFPGRKMHYRNKWYADLGEAPLLFALGIHGQYLLVDRQNQLVIVMMSSQGNPLDAELISLTMTAVPHIREVLMTDIILWRRIDLPIHEPGSLQRRDDRWGTTCSARGSTIASQSLRGKGITSL
jgi:CubicO group peptidase (beta-lactamase class C family)